nr:response regulator [Pseudomonas sp. Irchel s3h14]
MHHADRAVGLQRQGRFDGLHDLVDDHPLFRKRLAQLYGASDDFEVVGQASSGREGTNLAVSLTPQQVLLDLHMPGLSSLQVLGELR